MTTATAHSIGVLFPQHTIKANGSGFFDSTVDSQKTTEHASLTVGDIVDSLNPLLASNFLIGIGMDIVPRSFVGTENVDAISSMGQVASSSIWRSENSYAQENSFRNALSELEELDDYAKEENIAPPSPVAKELALGILKKLTSALPLDYSVSLWEDGDVVVYFAGAGSRVNLFCRTNGGASYYVNTPDHRDYEGHYQSADDMDMMSVMDALRKISA